MKRFTKQIAAAFALALATTPAMGAIIHGPAIFNPATGNNYHLLTIDGATTVSELEPYAVGTLGGHLATINDAAEDAWVFSTFAPIANGASDAILIIGLNDIAVELDFVWFDGEAFGYDNFGGSEPNGGTGENFVGILDSPTVFPPLDGFWVDFGDVSTPSSGFEVFGIAEVPVIPEPASLALLGLGGLLIAGRRRSA